MALKETISGISENSQTGYKNEYRKAPMTAKKFDLVSFRNRKNRKILEIKAGIEESRETLHAIVNKGMILMMIDASIM